MFGDKVMMSVRAFDVGSFGVFGVCCYPGPSVHGEIRQRLGYQIGDSVECVRRFTLGPPFVTINFGCSMHRAAVTDLPRA